MLKLVVSTGERERVGEARTVSREGVHAASQGLGVGAGAEGPDVVLCFGGDEGGRGGEEGDGSEVHVGWYLLVIGVCWAVLVLVAAVLMFDTSSMTRSMASLSLPFIL